MVYVGLAFGDILSSYLDSLNEVMTKYSLLHTFILLFWLLALTIGSAILFLKYIERLRVEIWKTRNMLNMIPNEVISHNKALKAIFLGKDAVHSP